MLNYLRLQLQRYYSTALDSVEETFLYPFPKCQFAPNLNHAPKPEKLTQNLTNKLKCIKVWIPPQKWYSFSLTYHPYMNFPSPPTVTPSAPAPSYHRRRPVNDFFWPLTLNAKTYTPETNMTLENHPFSIGNECIFK